jgi:hypothetical protein
MHMRQLEDRTLADIANEVGSRSPDEMIKVKNDAILVDLDGGFIELKSESPTVTPVTLPATYESLMALATWLEVPTKLVQKLDPDMQQYLLQNLLLRQPAEANVVYDHERGIRQILEPSQKLLDPRSLVDAVARVIHPTAVVSDFWSTPMEFRLDVMAPMNFERGIGGDLQVGDITRGGLRVFRDVAHNLAPTVAKWMFRLDCTNGMEIEDHSYSISARGGSVDEVMAEFERMADEAFRAVEGDIKSFYDLRTVKVDNPERTLTRIGQEQDLSPRTIVSLVEEVPAILDENGEATMFDVVNLITNRANDPNLRRRSGVVRKLQQVGGAMVVEHVERCNYCQSQLVHTN